MEDLRMKGAIAEMRIGAIEAGGTKFVCGIGNEHGVIEESVRFPTETPEVTMPLVIEYFADKGVEAIGVGSFGPINLDRSSPQYGRITTTPKPGWAQYDLAGALKQALQVPIGWDTDVNAAAYGEARWGAAQGLDSCVYFTIGTGVGVGIYVEGKLLHGLVHPEAGHVLVRRHPDDRFAGRCPYHSDCLEGMAAGPALEARWQMKGYDIPADHPAWAIEAYYIGQAVSNMILTISPKKVILGGGVMQQEHLFPLVREEVKRNLNGYVQAEAILSGIEDYIVAPGLGQLAGLTGALALGIDVLQAEK